MPNYYGFDEVVIDGLRKYSNCNVININYDVGFKYESFGQRFQNALSKFFLNKNRKPILKEAFFYQEIDTIDHIDYLIVNRPDILPESILDLALKKAVGSKLLLWDSLAKIHISDDILRKFQEVYSFDKNDCNFYGFKEISNFHFVEFSALDKVQYDAVFLGTVDARIEDLKRICHSFERHYISYHSYLHVPKERKFCSMRKAEILNKIVPFKYADQFSRKGKAIVDLVHNNQIGLSFRPFEAMALRKKLITNNTHIKEYDFYNPHNIYVIEDSNDFEIPKKFWTTAYEELPNEIYNKYHFQNWVTTILN